MDSLDELVHSFRHQAPKHFFFGVQRRYKYILVVKEGETLAWEHDMSHRHIRDISHFTTQDREKKNKAKMSTRKLRFFYVSMLI